MNANNTEYKQAEIILSHAPFSAFILLMFSFYYENSFQYGIFVPERSWEDLVCILYY